MSLDDMSEANGRRSTPASMTDEHSAPMKSQIKDNINLSDSKTKSKVLTNQTDIFGLLDMSPPERKKNTGLNPEVACFQPSEQTSATGSHHSGSPARLTKKGSRVPMYKLLCGRTCQKSNLFKPKFDCSMMENHDLSQPE
jgi:hypothetical protein